MPFGCRKAAVTEMVALMKTPRIAPLPRWKVDLVAEAIQFIEGEVGRPVTAEIIGRRIPAFSIEDIKNAIEQLKRSA